MQLSILALPWLPWPTARVRRARPGPGACAATRVAPPAARGDDAAGAGLRAVLQLLQEQLGLEAVHVSTTVEGGRRFRTVVALRHGLAAALATGRAGAGELLEVPVRLRGGALHGQLCCLAPAGAPERERVARALRHAAVLAGRLLEHERVLQDLARQSGHAPAP